MHQFSSVCYSPKKSAEHPQKNKNDTRSSKLEINHLALHNLCSLCMQCTPKRPKITNCYVPCSQPNRPWRTFGTVVRVQQYVIEHSVTFWTDAVDFGCFAACFVANFLVGTDRSTLDGLHQALEKQTLSRSTSQSTTSKASLVASFRSGDFYRGVCHKESLKAN